MIKILTIAISALFLSGCKTTNNYYKVDVYSSSYALNVKTSNIGASKRDSIFDKASREAMQKAVEQTKK